MAKSKITIVIDEETGDAEVRSPSDMSDDEVLDILSLAMDATTSQILQSEGFGGTSAAVDSEDPRECSIEATLALLPKKPKTYLN